MSFTRIREHQGDHQHEQTTVRFHGSLDVLTAPEVQGLIRDLVIERPREVVIDLADLALIDGSGVAALVSLCRHLDEVGAAVHTRSACGQPLEIFKLTGLLGSLGLAEAGEPATHIAAGASP